ncbi:hypothetical protein J7U46_19465 [Pelomonas sp. V22]|uniref:hypothetical protein n=1 Tax=Pelomonas sp. V22 TaxID=2822139 RepID=UPI0024A931F7|nr:hypothetical protein [Pelomonas sp. V22]MDI4635251.1 hypothetical protein [Pelomonas sp. V22]
MDDKVRGLALQAGWASASLPQGPFLAPEVQDFIKAVVAHKCLAARSPRATRNYALVFKTFFATTSKVPWHLNSEDIARWQGLLNPSAAALKAVRSLVRVINENLLSEACPLSAPGPGATFIDLRKSLVERDSAHKLPKRDALYELARIVFRERPETHNHLIRFSAIRVLTLTGLRLNEVLWLPADCLRWESHLDVVTGKPADQIGGVGQTLRLRHFALKQEEGRPDLLVEEHMLVPTRFQQALATAVHLALQATAELRAVLAAQHEGIGASPNSDLRRFSTSAGAKLTTADLLYLQPVRGRDVPYPVPHDLAVTTLGQNAIYMALGLVADKAAYSFFSRYGREPDHKDFSVKPHSLRHLMNTELFRHGAPDTVITQQFGRQTVAQSYEYDHRSLAEKLAFVSLPGETKGFLTPGSPQELVAKMVVGGLVPTSHIARSFKAIQAKEGDLAAFRYLAANSDGFHVTPYGYCVNSFSMNPCARHLKCFDRCKHFTASGLPEHRETLESLRAKLVEMRNAAAAKPVKTVGRRNQIAHAESLLSGVAAALDASPNSPVFEVGVDHSIVFKDVLS